MPNTTFVLTRFKNRNGAISWRVSGWLAGVRIRRNFKTREEAAAEKLVLLARTAQASDGIRSAATFLSDAQLREAEAAFRRLGGQPESLGFYLDFALTNYRSAERRKRLAEAVEEYLAGKRQEHTRGLLSIGQLQSIEGEFRTLLSYFPDRTVSHFTPDLLTDFFQRGNPSLKTQNNRRSVLATFFKFAFQKDWIVSNPVEKTAPHRITHRRGSATTLSAVQAAKLMAYLETFEGGRLVPYFAICLFAGVRPCARQGEISRLRPESVAVEVGTIHIEPEVSKVRMKRLVTIQPNLTAWLRAYPLTEHSIIPAGMQRLRPGIFKMFGLTHDVLRHTFISMFVGKFRSIGEAALQAGNSESMIRKHYLDLKTKDEAEAFFSIMPKSGRIEAPSSPRPAEGSATSRMRQESDAIAVAV